MTAEEIVKAAREAGFSGSEMHQKLAEFKRLIESAAAAERESCAMICDAASEPRKGYGQTDEQWAASTLAERIRARGNP